MKVLIATVGSYGDIYPFLALGARLKSRGHEVVLLTSASYQRLAKQQGLQFVPLGSDADYRRFTEHPELFNPRNGFSTFMRTLALPNLRPAYEELERRVSPGETVLLSHLAVFAARLIQEKLDVPNVTVHLAPLAIKSAYEIPASVGPSMPNWAPLPLKRLYWWVADRLVIDPVICPQLNSFRAGLGLAPASHVLSRWVHSPLRVICLFPEWYAAPQPDWPAQTIQTGFPLFDEAPEEGLGEEVEAFLQAGDPPIVFMPGSLLRQGSTFFTESAKACVAVGRRGLLLSRYGRNVPENLPDEVRHFRYVPFAGLLGRSAALVHHGGIGTGAQAMRAGLPQLIRPMAFDQIDNAARLSALGVAETLRPRDYRAEAVAGVLERLTGSPLVARSCEKVAARFENTDPLGQTCRLIEEAVQEPDSSPGTVRLGRIRMS